MVFHELSFLKMTLKFKPPGSYIVIKATEPP